MAQKILSGLLSVTGVSGADDTYASPERCSKLSRVRGPRGPTTLRTVSHIALDLHMHRSLLVQVALETGLCIVLLSANAMILPFSRGSWICPAVWCRSNCAHCCCAPLRKAVRHSERQCGSTSRFNTYQCRHHFVRSQQACIPIQACRQPPMTDKQRTWDSVQQRTKKRHCVLPAPLQPQNT